MPQRGNVRVKIWLRAECRPVSTSSMNGELAESASSSGKEVAQRVVHGDRPVAAADADVDVEAEGVVAPDDIAEDVVVAPVVRRVDDPLVLPSGPGVGAGGAELEPELAREGLELPAPSRHTRRRLGEVRALPRPHLRLRGDQLPDQVVVDLGAGGRGLQLLEPVDEVERLRVEQRELLLDGDGEVGAVLVRGARARELLL